MRLRLSPLAIASAAAFLHRFFAVKSMARNCRALVAAAALYLAGKVEETPARAREVLAAVDALVPLRRHCSSSSGNRRISVDGGGEGDDGGPEAKEGEEEASQTQQQTQTPLPTPLAADEGAMLSAVDALMTAERALLYALGFRLDVEHPFRTALSLAKEHGDSATVVGGGGGGGPSAAAALTTAAATDGDDGGATAAAAAAKAPPPPSLPGPGAKVLAQTAWNVLTDSLRTTLCLTHRPQAVGAAAFLVALRLHGADVAASASASGASSSSAVIASNASSSSSSSSSSPRWWWEGVGATPAEIASAADELLRVYEEGGGGGGGAGGSGGKAEEKGAGKVAA